MANAIDPQVLRALSAHLDNLSALTDRELSKIALDSEIPLATLQAARGILLAKAAQATELVARRTQELRTDIDNSSSPATFDGISGRGDSSVYARQLDGQLIPGPTPPRASPREAKKVFAQAQTLLEQRGSLADLRPHLLKLKAMGRLGFVDPQGMSLAMHAAALGRLDVLEAAHELGASLLAKNPENGANLCHYAALAVGTKERSPGRDILEWLKTKLEPAALVALLDARNTLSGHNVWVDALFYRNNPVNELILELQASLAKVPSGPQLDLAVATARGVPPSALVGRAARAFSEAVVQAAQAHVPPQVGDDYRAARNEQWATEWVVRMNVPEAQRGERRQQLLDLIDAAGRRDPAATTRLLESLGDLLPAGINAQIGYLGQTLLHLNIHGPRAGVAPAGSALEYQRFLLRAGADPLVHESGLMAASPFIRAAALGQFQLAIEMAEAVRSDPVRLRALVDAQGINNGRNAILDAAYGLARDEVATAYEFIQRMIVDFGANPLARAYDGIALETLLERSAGQVDGAPPIPASFFDLLKGR